MKIQVAIAIFLIIGVAEAGFAGGWMRQSTELNEESRALINFGLKSISEGKHGFAALEYIPVKILDLQTQIVAGSNTKILFEIDNGLNAFDSKKLVQIVIFTGLDGKMELTRWNMLDSAATFQALNVQTVLSDLKAKITSALAYEDMQDGKHVAHYNISQVHAAYETKREGQTLYYIKATVHGTDNSVRVHEFWFANENYDLFAHARLPMRRETLENHPKLTLIRDEHGVHCENLVSYFFCEIANGCENKMLGEGRCDRMQATAELL